MKLEKQRIGFPIPEKLTEESEQQTLQIGTIEDIELKSNDIPDDFSLLPFLEGYIRAEEEGNYLEDQFALRLLKACAERINLLELEIVNNESKRKTKKK